ncbi:thiamine phosphate synthase [Rhizobium helianthi]|uniref:Thiamine-phosphate synthase n=1 Tax=Rhizobium helianthi TaxID=1132695 RepID=A0ABW4M1B2_9HYPH
MRVVDYRLNAIVDASLLDVAPLAELAACAARTGATLIQYRDKTASTRLMVERAVSIGRAIAGTGVPFVINDRVDVALAANADGVHLGAEDMEPETARHILGADAIIGVTVKSLPDADRAGRAPVNYACIGGVFETLSKVNPDPPVGIEGFRALRRRIYQLNPRLPVGAIAGITEDRINNVIASGADGVAAISALFRMPDAAAAVSAFRKRIDESLRESV